MLSLGSADLLTAVGRAADTETVNKYKPSCSGFVCDNAKLRNYIASKTDSFSGFLFVLLGSVNTTIQPPVGFTFGCIDGFVG